jgi:putative transposase
VERESNELPLTIQSELLGISRSSLYYQPREPSAEEIAIKHRIDELYTDYPYYGSRRLTAQLRREGVVINRKAVQGHMREMVIVAVFPGPNVSRRKHKEQVRPYLLRNLTVAYPNHVRGIDITYIRMQKGWMYLVAILDWYSRYVWESELSLSS